ncbi:MAG: 2-phospho-L-lactate guanylyltransferase [Anaerolineae bacterium]|nr:2-phospho-L-lactate guanylyltransferase [Anaerolineae bacterium]
MNVWAIVPVKPLGRAKSRLAEVFSPEQREQLATDLLMRTVGLLLPILRGVLVISRDSKALSMVRDLGAQTVQESGTPELNNAILRASQVLRIWHAEAMLVVPADLPLLAAADVDAMVELGRYNQSVVIAPDRHETGTNLLMVRPPGLIPYSFGENSFAEHQRLAQAANATLHIYRSERVGVDIDTPEDVLQYHTLAKLWGEPIMGKTESEKFESGEWMQPELP